MEDIIEKETREKAINHIEELLSELDYLFDPSMNLKQYALDLHELLRFYKKSDYKIIESKYDDTIYRYIYDREIKYTKFSDGYREVREYVLSTIKSIYDQYAKTDRQNSSDGYLYYDNSDYRDKIASIVIMEAIRNGYSYQNILDGELNNEISNTILRDSVRVKSIGKKYDRIRTADALKSKPMTPEQIKATIIAIITFFAIVGLSTKMHNDKEEARRKREARREKHTAVTRHTPSHKDLMSQVENGEYNFDENVFTIEDGESIAKLWIL